MSSTTGPTEWRVAVVVPTYNEAENVGALAGRVLAADPRLELLIVDDASPDGTGEVGDAIAEREPRFHVLHRTGPRGYAPSSQEGLDWALDRDYDVVCTMDGDLSHDPARIPAMLARVERGAGVVIGSRYVPGGGLEVDWSPWRREVSRLGSAYARLMIGTPVRDCTSGYRCYSAASLRAIRLDSIHSAGYSFLIQMLARLVAAGVRIEEEPMTYIDRQKGRSKMSGVIVVEALAETTLLGIARPWRRKASA